MATSTPSTAPTPVPAAKSRSFGDVLRGPQPASPAYAGRIAEGDRRPARGHRADFHRHFRPRPLPDDRRSGPGQDPADQHHGADLDLRSSGCSSRPTSCPRTSPARSAGRRPKGPAGFPVPRGSDLHEYFAGGRNQPHAAEDPGRPARGHAGTRGDRRRTPTNCPIRSSCWPRRTRSSRKAPIRCPRPSSTASCSTSRSIIPRWSEEERILAQTTRGEKVEVRKILSSKAIVNLQGLVDKVAVSEYIVQYVARLARFDAAQG